MIRKSVISVILSVSLLLLPLSVSADNREKCSLSPVADGLLSEVSELESLEEGEDYTDRRGVFLSDNRDEAEKMAELYNADLISFDHGVARVRFDRATGAALMNAAHNPDVDRIIEPDYIYELSELSLTSEVSITSEAQDPYASSESEYYQYFHEKIHDSTYIGTVSGAGVRVAVIDSGVDPFHEELVGKVSLNCVPAFENSTGGVDIHGHGTHVAGIIAANYYNGVGGYGVAPAVSINSIKVTDSGKFNLGDLSVALSMALKMDVQVISMSLGSEFESTVVQELLDKAYEKGMVCVSSAGNGGTEGKHFPGSGAHCLAVAATTKDDKLADYSSYGDWVDIAAPGTKIYSTNTGSSPSENIYRYKYLSGTSQAVPMVSGVAALCYSAVPELKEMQNADTAGFIMSVICGTSDKRTYTNSSGYSIDTGVVQADKAVEKTRSLNLSSGYSIVDAAGHHGALLSGSLCEGKSMKLKIGNSGGTVDKALTKSAVWESSDPDKVTVKKGKVKCTKKAHFGDMVYISARAGDETLYYTLSIDSPVKKLGIYDSKILTSYTEVRSIGEKVDISDPDTLIKDKEVYAFESTKKEDLSGRNISDNTRIANDKFRYAIMISDKDKGKLTVEKTDSNGAPLLVTLKEPGRIKIKYKLINGSNKVFKVTLEVR